ncbi:MAG: fatty acid desaturase [Acidobacteriota bacterium]
MQQEKVITHKPATLTLIGKLNASAFFAIHLGCIAAFFLPFSWSLVAVAVALYLVRMFGITAGYHRYFSHRSFKTSRVFQFVLAFIGAASLQKGALWWAAHHRHHHRHSDQVEDIHSPHQDGLYWSHLGWIFCGDYEQTDWKRIADFSRYPELMWLEKYHQVPGVVMSVLLFAFGGLPALVWGLCISTVATWHATFAINSLTHLIGKRRYETRDDSRNHWLLALLTLGEGWHNNHHYYKASVRQGFFWWEVDISYYVLKMLSWVGIVWDLKTPSQKVIENNRVQTASPESTTADSAA